MTELRPRAQPRATTPAWVESLRAAASGAGVAQRASIEVVRGRAPGWLAGDAVHALTSLMLAALVIAAALLRRQLDAGPFDLIGLVLQVAGFAFALRALIALGRFLMRVSGDGAAAEHVLAWSDEGLFWRSPEAERWLARGDVIDLLVPSERKVRGAAVSLQPLLVIARPTQPLDYWQLPPYFAPHSELLAARLARFRAAPTTHVAAPVPPLLSPDERYQRAARGQLAWGEIPVPEGFGYRARAPYGVLLAALFVAGALLDAGKLRAGLLPIGLAAAALAPLALAIWFLWMRKRRAARLGMAFLLTPEELLIRGKRGVVSVPWTQLQGAELDERLSWSPWVGSFLVQTLWFYVSDGTRMAFDAGFLGVPPELISTLANGYRSGGFSLPASQGSGGGGGISASAGDTTTAITDASPSEANATRPG